MRIAFDYQTFCLQSYGGVSRYFVRLAQQFLASKQTVGVFAPLHRNRHASELPQDTVHGRRLNRYPQKTTRLFLAYNHFSAKQAICRWQPQIVHETFFALWRSGPKACPTVITVYDMIHELFSNEFRVHDSTSWLKQIAVNRADHVICISESTKRDLIRLFGIAEDKLSVVHLGFERFVDIGQHAEDNSMFSSSRPFLLYVGNRAGYKNFRGFLRAVASSSRLQTDFDVIAFGGGPFSVEEQLLIAQLGFRRDQVRHLAGDDEALGQLYNQARAFVYPSLYEGFGLPPLEAMAHRCPVVSSNSSSMPEVIADAGVFFDPAIVEDMTAAIERVVYSDQLVEALIQKGIERLNFFSWERCADQTLSIYRKFVG